MSLFLVCLRFPSCFLLPPHAVPSFAPQPHSYPGPRRTSSMNSTPGTISALPSSRHSATFMSICSRTSCRISPVSPENSAKKPWAFCGGKVGQCSVIPQSDGEQLKKASGIRAAVGQGKEYSLLMTKRAPHPTTPAPLQPFLRALWPPPACALICAQHLLTSHPA